MNILVLHGMGDSSTWLSGVADVELMFPTYDQGNNYLVHSGRLPLPEEVAAFPFSAIIMTSTFVDRVVEHGLVGRWIQQYEFLKNTSARKIVFPQDDYWQCEVRDQFYVDWAIDEVFPVCPPDSWPELIPLYLKAGGRVSQGYTTYVTPYMRNLSLRSKPWSIRRYDVVYRASRLPTAPNKLGMIKAMLGDTFEAALGEAESGLKINIRDSGGTMMVGSTWHDFVGNSRAILGSNSGSSIRLRNREVARGLRRYQLIHPELSLEQIEVSFLPPEDRDKSYTAISPRNLEAAMLGTLQVLLPGPYSGILKPYKHYIPLEVNCKNARDIVDLLRDEVYCSRIVEACRERVLSEPDLNSESLIDDVLSRVRLKVGGVESSDNEALSKLIEIYEKRIWFSKIKSRYLTRFKKTTWSLLPNYLKTRMIRALSKS